MTEHYGTWEFSVLINEPPVVMSEPGNRDAVLLTAQEVAALPKGAWVKIKVTGKPGEFRKLRGCPQCTGLRKVAEGLGPHVITCARCGGTGTPGWIPLETTVAETMAKEEVEAKKCRCTSTDALECYRARQKPGEPYGARPCGCECHPLPPGHTQTKGVSWG